MKYAIAFSSLAATSLAAVHQVTVGPGLSYSPDTVTAAQGDIVSFTFGSGHDVVSGSFDSPCQPSGGIYSGLPSDGDVFSVTVNNTNPIWIYCSVPHHCQGGMAMVINPPSGHTIDDYKTAASSTSGSSAPSNVEGGVFGAVSGSSSSSSASSSASSASSSASSAASSASASVSSANSSASSSLSSALSSATSAASSASSATASGNSAVATAMPVVMGAAAGLLALL